VRLLLRFCKDYIHTMRSIFDFFLSVAGFQESIIKVV
jgi:hypothetical protein